MLLNDVGAQNTEPLCKIGTIFPVSGLTFQPRHFGYMETFALVLLCGQDRNLLGRSYDDLVYFWSTGIMRSIKICHSIPESALWLSRYLEPIQKPGSGQKCPLSKQSRWHKTSGRIFYQFLSHNTLTLIPDTILFF